jgi:hypothetical protein
MEKGTGFIHVMSPDKLEKLTRRSSTSGSTKSDAESTSNMVVGSTSLYDQDGKLRLIPAPTPDPKGKLATNGRP